MYIYICIWTEKANEMSGGKRFNGKNRKTEPNFFLWYKARMDPMCSFYVQTTSARSETGTPTKHSSTIHTPGMGIYPYSIHTIASWTEWRAARKKSVRNGELFENWWRIYTGLSCMARACVCIWVHVYGCWQFSSGFPLLHIYITQCQMCERVSAQIYTWMAFRVSVFVEFEERKTRATPKNWEKLK